MEKTTYFVPGMVTGGPYSHATKANGFIYCSGQIAYDMKANKLIEDIQAATKLILENQKATLEYCGSSLDRVIKANVYLSDMGNFGAMNEVYATFFPNNPPARTCVAVKTLPLNASIEIELIALE